MNNFPWDIIIGLGVVLSGTIGFIVYILLLDTIEDRK
jgi:preprotein translocase subunit Sss1